MPDQYSNRTNSDSLREFRDIASATIESSTTAQRALAFGVVPTILLFVGALPPSLQHQWALQIADPTLLQAFFSNYVHSDINHLSNNILSYLLLMAFLFPLAVSGDKLRLLWVLSTLFLTVVPLFVSVYSLLVLTGTPAETVVGFSGVNAAYAGALPMFIAHHANEKVMSLRVKETVVGLMGIELGIVLWLAGLQRGSVVILAVLGLISLALAARNRRVIVDFGRQYESHLLVYGLLTFAAVPMQMLVFVDAGTNVFGHLIGLTGGFLLTLVVTVVQKSLHRFSNR